MPSWQIGYSAFPILSGLTKIGPYRHLACRKINFFSGKDHRLVYTPRDMRLLCFLPLTFIAGVQGFAIFAPYLCVFLTAAHVVKRMRA